jgi:hypothetical protein
MAPHRKDVERRFALLAREKCSLGLCNDGGLEFHVFWLPLRSSEGVRQKPFKGQTAALAHLRTLA